MQKLDEILKYYVDTYEVKSDIADVKAELLANNVEVSGNSFYCPIWNEEHEAWILLAGTTERADIWVLKKIIKLIKSGDTIYTIFNGNSDHLIKMFSRYDLLITLKEKDLTYLTFNKKEK